MSLQDRLHALVQSIGADIKALYERSPPVVIMTQEEYDANPPPSGVLVVIVAP